jgi:long-chain fatty acid transport protein
MASNYARLDFSNSNDFTGQAKGSGWTGKFGATFKASKDVNLGLSYQMKTRLSDLTTGANGAQFTLISDSGMGPGTAMPAMNGKIIVRNFQMPSVLAAGASLQVSPVLNLVADVKRIGWSSVMKSFNMGFDMGGGQVMNFGMPQSWDDQTVISLGGSYKMNDAVTVRAGYSHSTNPIPDSMVNPLFPAIVKDHYMAGFGYQINKNMTMDAAISHAPKVSVVNSSGAQPVAITHSQTNYQLMLSYRY